MIKWAWDGYRKYAWPKDEFHPIAKRGSEWLGMGATIVDGLDTLFLAGLSDEFKEARDWTATELNVGPDIFVNVFETTIRMVGGLMSASHLQGGDDALVGKAEDLVVSDEQPRSAALSPPLRFALRCLMHSPISVAHERQRFFPHG